MTASVLTDPVTMIFISFFAVRALVERDGLTVTDLELGGVRLGQDGVLLTHVLSEDGFQAVVTKGLDKRGALQCLDTETALLCVEADPHVCHRSILVDRMQEKGVRLAIRHL
jgi:hypothetical protein